MAKSISPQRFMHIAVAAHLTGLPEQHLADAATVGAFRNNLRVSLDGGVTRTWLLNVKELERYVECLTYEPNGERLGITRAELADAEKRMGMYESPAERKARKAAWKAQRAMLATGDDVGAQ